MQWESDLSSVVATLLGNSADLRGRIEADTMFKRADAALLCLQSAHRPHCLLEVLAGMSEVQFQHTLSFVNKNSEKYYKRKMYFSDRLCSSILIS